MRRRLERYFEFDSLKTNWRTEILAGMTTFVTMSYIIFVNPSILRDAGMPFTPVVAATCLSAAFGSLLMGAWARYPIALAPGMGLNAYFAYVVVKGMGLSWEVALGAVFLSGALFVALAMAGVIRRILASIPTELYSSIAAGIGLLLALIGFRNSGIIVPDASTTVALGNLRAPNTLLAIFGLLLIAALLAWRVKGAMLIGILATVALGAATGLVHWTPQTYRFSGISATALRLDLPRALGLGFVEIVFVFFFIDVFDNVGTLVAVGRKARLFDDASRIPRVNRILISDASATIAGSLAGTSTVVNYIESAAGVVAGGRSGVTSIVTGLLFLAALFVAPVFGVIPSTATAPALIIVGCLMISHISEIRWDEPVVAIPAFLTMTAIPLSFSIANGIAFGFTAYTLLKILHGEYRQVGWLVYVLTALFILRFVYLGST
ncbi:MAG: NCS2 family permease [Bryobacterales bacterium]|nr:NCS2 family permease [Bryobacterales bacterium]